MTSDTPALLPLARIHNYHAHIYFNDNLERERAAVIREQIAARFVVQLGRWRDMPVGPHTRPMYQVAFDCAQFAIVVPWLMLNRQDLAVLVHPNTDNQRRDHATHSLWLGEILLLKLEILPEFEPDEPIDSIVPNTAPTLPA